jgi:transposase InsO family protein
MPFFGSAPRYLLHDRDRIFGQEFLEPVKAMCIKQVLSAQRSPWQRAYVERVIGSLRRECLDHVIVFNEGSLYHIMSAYCAHYHNWRTHLSLGKDVREPRRVEAISDGEIIAAAELGGLHHHYHCCAP